MGNQDFHQVEQELALHLTLELGIPVSALLVELDTSPSALLVHLEAMAPAPFRDQETPAWAREADSPPSDLWHQATVPALEAPASAQEVYLEPLALGWEEPQEAAALP